MQVVYFNFFRKNWIFYKLGRQICDSLRHKLSFFNSSRNLFVRLNFFLMHVYYPQITVGSL